MGSSCVDSPGSILPKTGACDATIYGKNREEKSGDPSAPHPNDQAEAQEYPQLNAQAGTATSELVNEVFQLLTNGKAGKNVLEVFSICGEKTFLIDDVLPG